MQVFKGIMGIVKGIMNGVKKLLGIAWKVAKWLLKYGPYAIYLLVILFLAAILLRNFGVYQEWLHTLAFDASVYFEELLIYIRGLV